MKKPFTLDSAFLSLQEENTTLKRRLEKLETWEPNKVNMQVFLSGNLAITGGAGPVTIPFDTVKYDPKSTFNLTSYLFTAPMPGVYLAVTQGINFGGAGSYTVVIVHNDITYFGEISLSLATTYYNFSQHFQMVAGDTLQVTFESTGNTTLVGSITSTVTSFSVSLM